MDDLVETIWQIFSGSAVTIVASLVGLSILVFFGIRARWARFMVRLRRMFRRKPQGPDRGMRALARVARREVDGAKVEGDGIWTGEPIHMPTKYGAAIAASRVLAVGNLKGGVGKTTLSGNLAVAVAEKLQRKVLVIDLDFQGSLSSVAVEGNAWRPLENQSSEATRLVSGDTTLNELLNIRLSAQDAADVHVVPAWYDLGVADNRMLVEWLLSDPTDPEQDRRYWLSRLIQDPKIRETYGLVIIDCPPRLTMSHVQALCAASHLIIPTIMDWKSSEAVVSYLREIARLRQTICPHLRVLGIAGSRWRGVRNEVSARDQLDALLKAEGRPAELLPQETFFSNVAYFDQSQIAYTVKTTGASDLRARAQIEAMADEVIERMPLR